MRKTHVLVVPDPAKGQVIPLIEFSHELVKHGVKITFVNNDFNHRKIMKAEAENDEAENEIQLVSIPDGLPDGEDRNNFGSLTEAMYKVMPQQLEMLIKNINMSGRDNIAWVVADGTMLWALEIAEKLGIQRAAFWPASASLLTLIFSSPKLLDEGIIDSNGIPTKDELIQLSSLMLPMRPTHFIWTCVGELTTLKISSYFKGNTRFMKVADWIICNSTDKLEPAAFALAAEILPIGPPRATNQAGHFARIFFCQKAQPV